MVREDRIIAVGLLTAEDLQRLGPGFRRLFPIDETPCFEDLLRAIDDADRALRPGRRPANDMSMREGPAPPRRE